MKKIVASFLVAAFIVTVFPYKVFADDVISEPVVLADQASIKGDYVTPTTDPEPTVTPTPTVTPSAASYSSGGQGYVQVDRNTELMEQYILLLKYYIVLLTELSLR